MMSSAFADTHNMVAILTKSAASEGFDQIIDILNGSHIQYALTINPHIYVSCIKQFWNTVTVRQSNDDTRLQALVDKKRVVITKSVIRDVLHLDDAEGVDCLPNEEIFVGLARMGYDKPSTNLTSYKAFFLSQWKFLIHTILQSMSDKRTSWNEFSSAMASAVICLSTGDLSTHTTKYISPALTQMVFANMRRVGKGCTGVETPLFEAIEPNIPAATITAAPVKVTATSTRRRKRVVIRDPKEESSAKTHVETKSKDKGKGIMVEEPKPMKKKQQVETDEAYATKLHEELNQDINWDVAIDHVKQKAKEDPYVQRYQMMKKRPQIEAQARRNMIMYLKNNAGFRLDYFKGMSYDDIRLIFEAKFISNIEFLLKSKEQIEEEENRALESINETPAHFGVDATKELEEKHQVFNAASEELCAAK
nr:hypothetical protein [Tanacetum cinerariifolium]